MSATALDILRKATKPKSQQEVDDFLTRRHGAVCRENASADLSALDERARRMLATLNQNKTTA